MIYESHFLFTVGLEAGGELYELDTSKCKATSSNSLALCLTRPLLPQNPILYATTGTWFPAFIVRQYDKGMSLVGVKTYRDVRIQDILHHPDMVVEFTYRSCT